MKSTDRAWVRRKRSLAGAAWRWACALSGVLLAVVTVRSLVVQPFTIPSESMLPTLMVGDYVAVSKFPYGYSRFSFPFGLSIFSGRVLQAEPRRGDIVVFRAPRDEAVVFVKRVVGLPGDRVQMREGRLYIDGSVVSRSGPIRVDLPPATLQGRLLYTETLPEGRSYRIVEVSDAEGLDDTPEHAVPEGHYFVLGDNRDYSADSRIASAIGMVPAANVIGRADWLFFSTDGTARLWQVWRWPWATRFERLFRRVP